MSRLHPFDHAFGHLADEWFGAIREDATRSARDLEDRGEFARLATVQDRLSELAGEGDARTVEHYLQFLYAAYRFWAAGQPTRSPTRPALEAALDRDPVPPLHVPGGACYVQLPERLGWSRTDSQAPLEPIDGFFVSAGLRGREIQVVAVLGLRPGRDGFSQIAASATQPDVAAAARAAPPPRFAPHVEGGAAAGIREVHTVAELLLLASLALAGSAG